MARLTLELTPMPSSRVLGSYDMDKDKIADEMPARSLFLAPDAAASYLDALADVVAVSDMFRVPASSLAAVRAGRGAQPPGFSLHNFGIAIDLDTGRTMERGSFKNKAALDAWMVERGWFCHRTDHLMKFECWHFNFLGVGFKVPAGTRTTERLAEAEIRRRYAHAWTGVTPKEVQAMLAQLGLYGGAIDGIIGPISRAAIAVFQRGWGIPDGEEFKGHMVTHGKADPSTIRTLVYITADRNLIAA